VLSDTAASAPRVIGARKRFEPLALIWPSLSICTRSLRTLSTPITRPCTTPLVTGGQFCFAEGEAKTAVVSKHSGRLGLDHAADQVACPRAVTTFRGHRSQPEPSRPPPAPWLPGRFSKRGWVSTASTGIPAVAVFESTGSTRRASMLPVSLSSLRSAASAGRRVRSVRLTPMAASVPRHTAYPPHSSCGCTGIWAKRGLLGPCPTCAAP